jgi:(2R)-3-sulfolactate dehydrogenase (NADP+)
MLADDGVRLPGARRQRLDAAARERGLEVPDAMLASLESLARA